jgi:hypothetical protein
MIDKLAVLEHYEASFNGKSADEHLPPTSDRAVFDHPFCVWEFPSTHDRPYWKYATFGMCFRKVQDRDPIELHLFSPVQDRKHVELLSAIAHFHLTAGALWEGHVVNFGRPWLPKSRCSYGLISKPYVDGPDLEYCPIPVVGMIRFLWLLPITSEERNLALNSGLEALEARFDRAQLDFLDAARASTV